MASNRKYAALPDLDSAPDVYETPDLTDDHSTLQTTSPNSSYRAAIAEEVEDEDDYEHHQQQPGNEGISRRHLQPNQARSFFSPARVDANGVDFSDRISGKRRSYRTSSRRRRRRRPRPQLDKDHDDQEVGHRQDIIEDDDDDDDNDNDDDYEEESLQRRMARLRRELEEVREEVKRRRAGKGDDGEENQEMDHVDLEGVTALTGLLDDIRLSGYGVISGAEAELASKLEKRTSSEIPWRQVDADGEDKPMTADTARSTTSSNLDTLSKATSSFDTRLALIEKALGISSGSSVAPGSDDAPYRPIIPTLETLYGQIMSLAEASPSSLDALSQRIQQLVQDEERLNQVRSSRHRRSSSASSTSSTSSVASAREVATILAGDGSGPSRTRSTQKMRRSTPAGRSGGDGVSKTTSTAGDGSIAADATAGVTAATKTSGRTSSSRTKAQIRALYRTIPMLERLSPLLPPLLDRLQSLHGLHADAARANQTLDAIERAQEDTQREIVRWTEALKQVEAKMSQGEDVLRSNVHVVESWVRELEDRLDRLTS